MARLSEKIAAKMARLRLKLDQEKLDQETVTALFPSYPKRKDRTLAILAARLQFRRIRIEASQVESVWQERIAIARADRMAAEKARIQARWDAVCRCGRCRRCVRRAYKYRWRTPWNASVRAEMKVFRCKFGHRSAWDVMRERGMLLSGSEDRSIKIQQL